MRKSSRTKFGIIASAIGLALSVLIPSAVSPAHAGKAIPVLTGSCAAYEGAGGSTFSATVDISGVRTGSIFKVRFTWVAIVEGPPLFFFQDVYVPVSAQRTTSTFVAVENTTDVATLSTSVVTLQVDVVSTNGRGLARETSLATCTNNLNP